METNLSDFEQRFLNKFRKGEVKAFIIVTDPSDGSRPIISLIHRARFGSELLPIPAWVNRSKAEQFLQNHSDVLRNKKVMEATHHDLQEMIERHDYDSLYPQAASYHLDLQTDEKELKEVLKLE